MRKKVLLLPVVAILAYVTLSSHGSGYIGDNRTASDGGSPGCGGAGCHAATASTGATGLSMTILLDSAGTGNYVTRYSPGKSYVVRMVAGVAGSFPRFGFQLSSVKGTGSASAQAGTFSGVSGSMALTTIGGRDIVRHTTPLSGMVVSGATIDSVNVNWTAPAVGTGTVTMYGVINAVNFDGSASSSDKWNNTSATFTELPSSTGVQDVQTQLYASLYPNPVYNRLNIKLSNASNTDCNVIIYNMNGYVYLNTKMTVSNGSGSLDLSQLPTGIYNMYIENEGAKQVASIVKQ